MKGLPNCLVCCHKPPEEVAAKQRFVSTWSQIWPKSVEISVNYSISSAPSNTPPSTRQPRFISFILSIGLAIETIFQRVFDLDSRNFGGFNNVLNALNNEYTLELECDLRDVLSSQTSHTIDAADTATTSFNFGRAGVGLPEFGDLEYAFDLILNEYEINNVVNDLFDNGIVTAYYFAPPSMFWIFLFFLFCGGVIYCFVVDMFYVVQLFIFFV